MNNNGSHRHSVCAQDILDAINILRNKRVCDDIMLGSYAYTLLIHAELHLEGCLNAYFASETFTSAEQSTTSNADRAQFLQFLGNRS